MTNSKQRPTTGRGSVTAEQAGEQMPMPVRYKTEKEQVGGAVGSAQAFLRTTRASLKPAHPQAMELRKEKQREKRPESVRQHFVLSARESFFFLVLHLL